MNVNNDDNERLEQQSRHFEALLEYLRDRRALDFTGYKRTSLMRRITKRMQTVGAGDVEAYQDYLEVHPEEFALLFDTILINVTGFFRDKQAWDYLAGEIVPKLLSKVPEHEPIRAWSAGCSSGEEAYTLAIILAEKLGMEAFKRRVKIYATDIDEAALAQARHASYSPKAVEEVPPELLERYFEQLGNRYVFRNDIRRQVIFGRNDLTQDAPISHLDLLVCRNTLMYMNADTQNRVLSHFHFALKDTGYLFLGRAEMLLTRASLFTPVSMKHRIFQRMPREAAFRDRGALALLPLGNEHAANRVVQQVRLREASFESAPWPSVVLDIHDTVVMANAEARHLFGLQPKDLGRPFRDLELSYRPIELRSVIEEVSTTRRTVNVGEIEWPGPDNTLHYFEVTATPLLHNGGRLLGVMLSFQDVSGAYRLKKEVEHSKQELETAYEELQSSNEELETTNEELQSTNEELETTNEELQATNEELETMNEELQSTNEELQTMNDELRQRTEDLNKVNAFLEAVLASMRVAAVAVDDNLTIQLWNSKAADLWGLRSEEVIGTFFLNLDIGLPVEELKTPIRKVLQGLSDSDTVVLDATNRRGMGFRCRVSISPNTGFKGETQGVIMLMEGLQERQA